MSAKSCPRCGRSVSPDALYCPFCGTNLIQPSSQINTHSHGWMVMSFLISLLWLKINNVPIFPLGFLGGLVISFWSSDIDRALGKEHHTGYSIILSVAGMTIGLIIR